MLKEFKEFIMKGNVLDMAVGVVMGSAFTAIVNKVVEGLITPLVGWFVSMFTGTSNLDDAMSVLDWSPAKGVTFSFGDVVSALITFLITGFVLFLVVKTTNRARDMKRTKEDEKDAKEETPAAEEYLKEIRDLLSEQNKRVDTKFSKEDLDNNQNY